MAETGALPPNLMQVAASMGIAVNAQGVPVALPSITPSQSVQSAGHWTDTSGHHPPGSSYYPPPPPSATQWATRPVLQPSPIPPAPIPSNIPQSTGASSVISGGPATPSKKNSAQFVRAISYVKKIKHRFANDPNVYKTFLASLHSYHKEQKSIYDVYMEVAALFADHQDLLEEFVLFLPEQEAAAISNRLSQAGLGPSVSSVMGSARNEVPMKNAPRVGDVSMKRPAQAPPPPSKTSKRARQAAGMSSRTAEESAFYERVKRYLGDKNAYAEFLKCLNLFCQDIIKMSDLVQLVSRFIGQNEELFGWFKRYIGYKNSIISEDGGRLWKLGESAESDIVNEHGELNLAACKKIGSYRIYPKTHSLAKSSHRTAIGKEVLNDTMVSCPVFNSEDSTFVASKKNMYEEALFRCEDERFELDLLVDHNLDTIAVFEPLARKIEAMSPEERSHLTLGPTLGGTSTVIYKKAIQRIYGDKADEVINGILKNPAVAVAVVLRRLKQKDEEWRRVQRDWNKIWRDVHLKNYYKALDHQGLEFKANDRKNITGRNLVTELETIATERKRAVERGENIDNVAPHHLEFTCSNYSKNANYLIGLIKAFVKGSVVPFSKNDRRAILKFVFSFLSNFFCLSHPSKDIMEKSTKTDVAETSITGSESEAPSEGADESMSESESAFSGARVEGGEACVSSATVGVVASQTPVLLFANSNLYILVRLVQMALDRLEKLQTASVAANGSPFFTEKKNVVASFLDLQSQNDAVQEFGLKGDFYGTLLALLKQLVSGNLDGSVFEERVRFMFGTAAYPIFTFDKLIQTIVKQVQIILADSVCEHLVRLFDSWNGRRTSMRLSEYSARMAIEGAVPHKEPIVRIEYQSKAGKLTMQLLDRVSGDAGLGASAESRWSSYVDNFVKLESNPEYLGGCKIYLNRTHLENAGGPETLTVLYNLECKIAINTYKLFYVENTEDFLYRFHVKGRGKVSARRLKRFKHWLESTSTMQDS